MNDFDNDQEDEEDFEDIKERRKRRLKLKKKYKEKDRGLKPKYGGKPRRLKNIDWDNWDDEMEEQVYDDNNRK